MLKIRTTENHGINVFAVVVAVISNHQTRIFLKTIENSLWLWQNWSMYSEHKIKISEKFRVTKDQETKDLTLEIILALYIVIFSNQLSSIWKTRNFQGKCSLFCSSALFHQKDNLSPRWVPSKCTLTWDLIMMKQLSCFRPSLWIKILTSM